MFKAIAIVAIAVFVAPVVSAWFVEFMQIGDALAGINSIIGAR